MDGKRVLERLPREQSVVGLNPTQGSSFFHIKLSWVIVSFARSVIHKY